MIGMKLYLPDGRHAMTADDDKHDTDTLWQWKLHSTVENCSHIERGAFSQSDSYCAPIFLPVSYRHQPFAFERTRNLMASGLGELYFHERYTQNWRLRKSINRLVRVTFLTGAQHGAMAVLIDVPDEFANSRRTREGLRGPHCRRLRFGRIT